MGPRRVDTLIKFDTMITVHKGNFFGHSRMLNLRKVNGFIELFGILRELCESVFQQKVLIFERADNSLLLSLKRLQLLFYFVVILLCVLHVP